MNRWAGVGVVADNLINIRRAMEKQATTEPGLFMNDALFHLCAMHARGLPLLID
jgi:hypothetical protein